MTTGSQDLRPEPNTGNCIRNAAAAPQPHPRPARDGRQARLAAMALLPSADVLTVATASRVSGSATQPDIAYVATMVAVLAATGLYRWRITWRVSDQIGRIAAAAALALPVLFLWLPAGAALRQAGSVATAVVIVRDLTYRAIRAARKRGFLTEPALLVGASELGAKVADLLRDHAETGLRPIGFIDSGNLPHDLPLPVIGELAELPELIVRHQVRRVIVCSPADGDGNADSDLVQALRACRRLRAGIGVVPRLAELGAALPRASVDEIWGIPLIPLRRTVPASLALKRGVDVLAAAALLVVFSPVLLAAAAAILLGSGRPVIFRQARVTADGRIVEIMKLRTLPEHSDSDTRWSVPTEQLPSLQRWLRASHLDELPQLVSVLRGDMSLIGPRPERPYFVDCFSPVIRGYADRHRMRTGLTGWAQVNGLHGDTPIEDRARFDNHYIENWSFWLDAIILLRTLGGTLSARPKSTR
jgi:exopolysaccharide biosynthesis polyprenyl glycosylphosphotransferase